MASLSARSGWVGAASLVIALGGFVSDAFAHIDMFSPEPRSRGNRSRRAGDRNSNLKEAPCGQTENGRTNIVHDFVGGETIEVRFTEYVNHESYYRVAFDVDGDDDFPLREGPAASPEGDDPTRIFPVDGRNVLAYELNDGVGGDHAIAVTLPNVDCDNCTLQLLQYMYDTGRVYYFQCADLRITASEEAGEVLDAERDFGALLPPASDPPGRALVDAGAGAPDATPAAATEASSGGGCSASGPTTVVAAGGRRSPAWLAALLLFGLAWRRSARSVQA